MLHYVFLWELAQRDEAAPDYDEIAAGYLVLRLFDAWCRGSTGDPLQQTIATVRPRVAALPTGQLRQLLNAILAALGDGAPYSPSPTYQALRSYATWLAQNGHQQLALDVVHSIDGTISAGDWTTPQADGTTQSQLGAVPNRVGDVQRVTITDLHKK